jgi:tRNA modification GTPase
MDTIFALATAQGRAGVAVIRISGGLARVALVPFVGVLPEQGRTLRRLRDRDGTLIDEALVLTFAEGHSFTGEAVVELHLHGSRAVVAAVLGLLGDCPGLRHAEAGEFTRRALENGRLDLAQVEGLADLIDAETEAQRRQAIQVLQGALGDLAADWRRKLIRAVALIEATIDFSDEDVPVDVTPEVSRLLRDVAAEMRRQSDGVRLAERVRDGFEVAIVGAPNVGKSTLLNRLAGRDAAITSEIEGTTRDVIEVRMALAGLPVTLLDTAGLRDAGDVVEAIGIARGQARAEAADMRLHLVLPGQEPLMRMAPGDLVVTAKADLAEGGALRISALTGEGVEALIDAVATELTGRTARIGVAMRERHRVAMMKAVGHLEMAEGLLPNAVELADVLAEELRSGLRCVDSLVGRVDVEDILGEIFSSFCIGK